MQHGLLGVCIMCRWHLCKLKRRLVKMASANQPKGNIWADIMLLPVGTEDHCDSKMFTSFSQSD